jgi:hypothetical protein
MRKSLVHFALALLALTLAPGASSAQTSQLSGLLPDLVRTGARADGSRTDPADPRRFAPDLDGLGVHALSAALGTQFAAFPLDRSWGGFSVARGGRPGAREGLRPGSFLGAGIGERGTTLGRGARAFGFTQQTTRFGTVDGIDLGSGGLQVIVPHEACCAVTAGREFVRDVIEQQVALQVERTAYSFFGQVGLTDRLDLSVALPILKVNAQARTASILHRLGSAADPSIHAFDVVQQSPDAVPTSVYVANKATYAAGAAQGLGDIHVQAKVNMLRSATQALAGAVVLRLPTGDADRWLGTGVLQTEARLAWSGEYGRLGPHLTAAYTLSSGTVRFDGLDRREYEVPDDVSVTGGVEVRVVDRLTVSGDLWFRRFGETARFAVGTQTFSSPATAGSRGGQFVAGSALVAGRPGGLSQAAAVAGTRLLVAERWVLSGQLLLPLTDSGFMPTTGVVAGLNYVF